jgi:nitrogen fixation protein NifU and related proteins
MTQYSDALLHYFFHPAHVGQLGVTQSDVKTARRGEIGISDVLQLQIQLTDQRIIADAKFKVYGNPYAIAGMGWLAERLIGKTCEQARSITHQDIVQALNMPPTKLHTALQIEDILYEVLSS